jgi:hypothetical protein
VSRRRLPTFGELPIGARFTWPDGPGVHPITKVDDVHYQFPIHGGRALDGQWPDGTPKMAQGTAEPHYRVRPLPRRRSFADATADLHRVK